MDEEATRTRRDVCVGTSSPLETVEEYGPSHSVGRSPPLLELILSSPNPASAGTTHPIDQTRCGTHNDRDVGLESDGSGRATWADEMDEGEWGSVGEDEISTQVVPRDDDSESSETAAHTSEPQ